jgi:hypothetical protein
MRRAGARLANLGVKAKVADQLRGSGKRRMSPTAAMNVVAVIRLTPGTVISRLIACEPSACSAMPRSMSAISVSW